MIRKLFVTALLLAAAMSASAKRPRVGVEWGAVAGLHVTDFSTDDDRAALRNKLGWQAGIVTAFKFGGFAVEPQIFYVRQGFRLRPEGGPKINLKSSSIDVPVFFSLRMLRPLRIYAGPVFTVMNDCKRKSGGDLIDFARVRPTLSFSAGVGVSLLGHMLIDLRYNGQFKGKEDVIVPLSDKQEMRLGKLRAQGFSINFGYVF